MVVQLGNAVGSVVEAVRKSGKAASTIVIVTSDNGGSVAHGARNWPLRGGKFTIWDGGFRVPAFIYAPGIVDAGDFTHLFHATDWLPTIGTMD